MSTDHEVTFCSEAAGWMNTILDSRPDLPFSSVKIEQSPLRSRKRRDLTIFDRSGKIAITGEVKLPYMADGMSPFNESVVDDAVSKALKSGAPFFLTWNVNRIVLWKTDQPGVRLEERSIDEQLLTQVRDAKDLSAPAFQEDIRKGLKLFLDRAGAAFRGDVPLGRRHLDQFFVTVLEAGLERPILTVQHAIEIAYGKASTFKINLDQWMRDTQGWHLSDDALLQRDNLERAAKFSCYVLVNKIVFYLAMRRRWPKLKLLKVPSTITEAKRLREILTNSFNDAMRCSGDYETIFRGDFGDELPFTTDDAVAAWRDLLNSVERFDFTKLNYDVIGPIFERLISPEERHRYGQHYTKPEVVDLINAFCIRDANAVVMDPACGGGTFLVRAYARKKYLAAKKGDVLTHTEALEHLVGTDISAYATHLTTMNLATRDLIDDRNYPLVAKKDFFDVSPDRVILSVPLGTGGKSGQMQAVYVPALDAVVGNPPYVRQEEISSPPTAHRGVKLNLKDLVEIKAEQKAYKKRLATLAAEITPDIVFSGRSDLHVYFWTHVTKFLKDDAYFGFLTSSGWLDVEYGFRLQEFLLRNFSIIAVFESQLEPWFTGARVTTCATILRREKDEKKRRDNIVRFVQLRSLMSDIFPPDRSEMERQIAAESLRDKIESLTTDASDADCRVRVVHQGDLYDAGVKNAQTAENARGEDEDESEDEAPVDPSTFGTYFGSKWGIFLRAPDIYFDLAQRFVKNLCPLSALAEVRFGVKTGCDKFFFVRDVTEEHLNSKTPAEFKNRWGIMPFQTDRVRVVRAGDKSDHLLEAKFLEPEVHNLMENNGVYGIRIDPAEVRLSVFVCSDSRNVLKNSHALQYIRWGEKEGFDKGSTVHSRTSETREWYDLRPGLRGDLFWPMAQQYRHLVPLNEKKLIANHNLFDVHARAGVDSIVLCGVLNSSLVAMHKHLFGRWAGTEGNLKTEVVDVKMMIVPDVRLAGKAVSKRISVALEQMAARHTRNLVDEFTDPARQALDDAVLELLGIGTQSERKIVRERIYDSMTTMHQVVRAKELRANENKKRNKRGGSPSAESLAREIWDSLDPSLLRRFPEDFYGAEGKSSEKIELHDGNARVVNRPIMDMVELEMGSHVVDMRTERRAELALLAHQIGRRGIIQVPKDSAPCASAITRYRVYEEHMRTEFAQRAAEKTASEKLGAKIRALLEKRLNRLGNDAS